MPQQEYNEEAQIHKDITLEEYLTLSEEERESDQIYFIKDVSSQEEVLTKILVKIQQASEALQKLIDEYNTLNQG